MKILYLNYIDTSERIATSYKRLIVVIYKNFNYLKILVIKKKLKVS